MPKLLFVHSRVKIEGKGPEYPNEEWTYDSDSYPKRGGNNEESDTPQHCAAGGRCLNAITLLSGGKVGFLFGELTLDGVAYVKEAIAERSEVTDLWRGYYADYL